MNEQIAHAAMAIATIVPLPIAAALAVTLTSPIVTSTVSYHGPSGTTFPSQSTLTILLVGATGPPPLSSSIAALLAASASAVFGLQ
jgi:hypothetical protein